MSETLVGKHVGKYVITDLIGKGGMGAVYKAHDPDLERDVALKVMDPALAHDEAFMRRFRVEAKALAQLNNTHIVKVHALQDSESGVCIIMEFVRGVTLSDIIKQGDALDRKRLFHLFRQILSAFEYAHKAGVIHRDIKPSNIMVTDADEVKVTDFGLAKLHHHTSATVTQLTGGTLYYVSPEQIEGLANVDHRGDIYSIGMTLYEALTGTIPFEHTESDFRIRERIVNGKIRPPQSFNPAISKRLNNFVMKAIARRPEDRFQTVSEMLLSFDKIVEAEREEEETRHAVAPVRKQDYRKVAAMSIAALTLAMVFFFVYKHFSESNASEAIRTPPIEHDGVSHKDTAIQSQQTRQPTADTPAASADLKKEHDDNLKSSKLALATPGKKPAAKERERTEPSVTKTDVKITEELLAEKREAERAELERLEKERLRKTMEESARAKKGIETLVDRYKSALENGDLGSLKSLMRFSEKEENAWSKFFELSKEIRVSFEDLDVQNNLSNAEVAFKARLSYMNASKGEPATSVIRNVWVCENTGGRWVIVSRK